MSRLLGSQLTNSVKHKAIVCNRCLNHFYSEIILKKHLEYCEKVNECRIQTPDATHRILCFQNLKNQLKVPFVIYADIVSFRKSKRRQFHQKFHLHTETYCK